jgi:hypothetical protein
MKRLATIVFTLVLLAGLTLAMAMPVFAATANIVVTSPGASASWAAGSSQTVRWTCAALTGQVTIDLYKNNVFSINLSTNTNVGNRYFKWAIPWTQTPGDNYTIKVRSNYNTAISDFSDNFSIAAPYIHITSPGATSSWGAGTSQSITWASNATTGSVKIELYKEDILNSILSTNRVIGSGSGSFSWTIPIDQAYGNDYKIRVTSNTAPTVSDNSTAFAIGSPIRIISAAGGEHWVTGSTHQITWNCTEYTGLTGNVSISLLKGSSPSSSVVKQTITTGKAASLGFISWKIPSTLPDGNDYFIRISSVTKKNIVVYSFPFNLSGSMITTIVPNDNLTWQAGSAQNIGWNLYRVTGWLRIELWKGTGDNSTFYRLIASGSDAPSNVGSGWHGTSHYDGSYRWHLPVDLPTGDDYRIKIISIANDRIFDFSDTYFHIQGASLTITNPAGGEIWGAGSRYQVEWDYTAVLNGGATIELLKGGSPLSPPLISHGDIGVDGHGTNSWTFPVNLTPGNDYALQVRSKQLPEVFDISDNFSLATASIDVLRPDGGEFWLNNTSENITWATTLVTDTVKIDLFKGGSISRHIVSSVNASDHLYKWQIPSDIVTGNDYKVKITATYNSLLTDSSLNNFTIGNSITTTLLSDSDIIFGENVTDTVTVVGSISGTPSGNVDFQYSYDNGSWTTYSTKTLSLGTAISDNFSAAAAGPYRLRAVYLGDGTFSPSASGDSDELLTVNPGPIDHYIVLAENTQYDNITFTITVTAYDAFNNKCTNDSSTIVTMTTDQPSNISFTGGPTKILSGGSFTIDATPSYIGEADLQVIITATDGNSKTGQHTIWIQGDDT